MTDRPVKILLVDNYDSFTFNLVHLLAARENVSLDVRRNDEDFLPDVARGAYAGALIGPGPGSPEDAAYFGGNRRLILDHGTNGFPILGVCLGFQGIYHCFGGRLKLGRHPVHGKTSALSIEKEGLLLRGIPQKNTVMRYHSIFADTASGIPDDIEITAYTCDGDAVNRDEPMALEHKKFPIYGVQFHPESFATRNGARIIANFLGRCRGS